MRALTVAKSFLFFFDATLVTEMIRRALGYKKLENTSKKRAQKAIKNI